MTTQPKAGPSIRVVTLRASLTAAVLAVVFLGCSWVREPAKVIYVVPNDFEGPIRILPAQDGSTNRLLAPTRVLVRSDGRAFEPRADCRWETWHAEWADGSPLVLHVWPPSQYGEEPGPGPALWVAASIQISERDGVRTFHGRRAYLGTQDEAADWLTSDDSPAGTPQPVRERRR